MNRIQIENGGQVSALVMTEHSGKIIFRDKINTIIGVRHPGIVLGKDAWGTTWVIHNYIERGTTEIIPFAEFSKGQEVYFDPREVLYDRREIIERAVDAWHRQEPYHWLTNNCQHFVNHSAQGEKYSESINQISNGAMIIGGITALLGLFGRNKTLITIGLGVAGAGAVGKVINNRS